MTAANVKSIGSPLGRSQYPIANQKTSTDMPTSCDLEPSTSTRILMLDPSGVAYINGYGPERAGVEKEATGVTTKIVQSILGFIVFEVSTFVANFPHCLPPQRKNAGVIDSSVDVYIPKNNHLVAPGYPTAITSCRAANVAGVGNQGCFRIGQRQSYGGFLFRQVRVVYPLYIR